VSQLQEALFGLNRRLLSERKAEQGPLQGLKNTLGSLKDELFADDDWDDWNRPGSDPWAMPPSRYDREPAYREPAYREPSYREPPYREPEALVRERPPRVDDDPWGDGSYR
jgi:molecular chaperone DnaK